MDNKEEFLKKIRATFRAEAGESIDKIASQLIELEKGCSGDRCEEILEIVYRAVHSMKGASRAVDFSEFESICHAFEDVMFEIRNGELKMSAGILDIFYQSVDLLSELLTAEEGTISSELSEAALNLVEKLGRAEAGLEEEKAEKEKTEIPPPQEPLEPQPERTSQTPKTKEVKADKSPKKTTAPTKKSTSNTIRISTDKLDNVLVQAEEMLTLKLNSIDRTTNLKSTIHKLQNWKKEASNVLDSSNHIKQSLTRAEKAQHYSKTDKAVSKMVQFYDWTTSYLREIEREISELQDKSQQEEYTTSAKVDGLLTEVKELVAVPFSTLLDGFGKMVRDLAKDLSKQVNFTITGDDIEIDRRILENLRNPLIHLLRNSIDYGIEKEELRLIRHKPVEGQVRIEIERLENKKIEIRISDDGAGINLDKLKELYIKNENIAESEVDKIQESEYLHYIFKSGISTSDIITDISGRGVGLAIVQEAIDQLGGTIQVKTTAERSTTFTLTVPNSIVTFRGVLIQASGEYFIVPTTKVERVLRKHRSEIETIENKKVIYENHVAIPIIELGLVLELPHTPSDSEFLQILIFSMHNKQFGCIVDEITGEQEVLVKPFNRQLSRVRNISGATVLGSGKVVPVLNPSDLYKSSLKDYAPDRVSTGEELADTENKRSLLVVEDSITSRTLLKNILEAEGYLVTTAIDGIDGYTKFMENDFHAVVSDIEMPRMNGFELVSKIRSGTRNASIPIILITSLSRREDREKGIDVGANAYIIKSSFDQNNLFDALDNLI